MTSRLAWFTTLKGRRFVGGTALAATFSITAVAYLPHTHLMDYYFKLITLRKFNEPVPVPPKLKKLVDEVMDDLNVIDYHREITRPFMVFGYQTHNMGSLNFKTGTYIGLPINFTYTDKKSINKDDIHIGDEPINWSRPEAQQLLDSMVISDDAKKYAIAREILMTNNNFVMYHTLNSSIMAAVCYGMTAHLNEKLNMFEKPRAQRFILYALSATFFWGLWVMQKDTLMRYYEYDADQQIAELGERYIKGGIEYYEKVLQRNKALRSLSGKTGENMFKTDGEEVRLFRQKHLPFSSRMEFFNNKLKEKTQPVKKELPDGTPTAQAAVTA